MRMSFRLGVVLLSSAAIVAGLNSHTAFGQRFKSSNSSSQSGKDKKDKDKDDDDKDHKDRDKDKKDKKEQGGSSNQGSGQNGPNNNNNNNNNNNAGNANNQAGNPTNPNNPVKIGGANTQLFKQFNPKNQSDNDRDNRARRDNNDQDFKDQRDRHDDHDHRNDGPGGANKIGFGQPGFPNQNQNLQKSAISSSNSQPINKQFGSWKGDQWQGSHKVDSWSTAFGHKKPFSAEWYDDHPRAWKYDGRKSNVWVTATVPGVYTWLNWGSVPQQYQVGYNNGPRFDPSLYGEWYPLGVYSLMTGPDDVGTRVLQLAVDRRGRINGNYFDMITDSDHSVSGVIDRQTQRAEWSLNQNPNVQFRANIMRLLQPYGSITVQMPGGEQRWQFVRLEND